MCKNKKDTRSVRQIELARLSWQMQELQNAIKIDIEIQRTYNHEMRELYKQYVKIVGSADVAGWEKFSLFVLGFSPTIEPLEEQVIDSSAGLG